MTLERSRGSLTLAIGLLAAFVILTLGSMTAAGASAAADSSYAPPPSWLGAFQVVGLLALLAGLVVAQRRSTPTPPSWIARPASCSQASETERDHGEDRDQEHGHEETSAQAGAAGPSAASPAQGTGEAASPATTEAVPAGFEGVLRLGQGAVRAGDYDNAAGWFRTAVGLRPDLQVGHLCLGLCLEELGQHRDALDHLDQAVALDPEDGLPRYARARVLVQERQVPEAIRALAPLVQADQEVAQAAATDPAFRELRDHPRFLALLGRL